MKKRIVISRAGEPRREEADQKGGIGPTLQWRRYEDYNTQHNTDNNYSNNNNENYNSDNNNNNNLGQEVDQKNC